MKTYRVRCKKVNLRNNKSASSNKRIVVGGEIGDKIFEDREVKRATDLLSDLRLSKSKVPKKFISFFN